MDFTDYKAENLERIAGDARYKEHHEAVNAVLSTREKHLHVAGGIAVLRDVAAKGETIAYKPFHEALTGTKVVWSQGKAAAMGKFLCDTMGRCADAGLPMLASLVVRGDDGRCGPGFHRELVRLKKAAPEDDPEAAELAQREACWAWASNEAA
ncbi:hypothetical protein [Jannaschia sp. LMIT008]|uniref:hypothetical protein n=1 Tax=Jannaschia maritima TaxID=3032585 RepID=UPI002811AF07|nr:hypothetical protein [Jannaschia sp. LMIT008]